MTRILFTILLCALPSACINLKPTPDGFSHYVLGCLEADIKVAPASEESAEPALYVARPELPSFLEGSRLQYRSQGGAVRSVAGARWAEPLQEGVARALSEYLVRSDSYSSGGFYPWPQTDSDAQILNLRLLQFVATDDGLIHASGTWQVSGPAGARTGTFSGDDMVWTVGEASSLVTGLNRALEQLANQIGGQSRPTTPD